MKQDRAGVLIAVVREELREGINVMLRFETDLMIVGMAATPVGVIDLAKQHQPDVVLLDADLADIYDTTARVKQAAPNSEVLLLCPEHERVLLLYQLKNLVRDVVQKPVNFADLYPAVRSAADKTPLT